MSLAAARSAGLSRPLRDRCIVVEVPAPSGAEKHRVLDELVADLAIDHCIVPETLEADALAVLCDVGPRRARAIVLPALAGALDAGRIHLASEELVAAAALIGGGAPPRAREPVGFVRF